ncbi:TPA: hypothetical protein ACP37T_003577 [Pseudomonas aeruginosa]
MKRATGLLLLGFLCVMQSACSMLQSAAERAKADPASYQALDMNAHFFANDPDAKLGDLEMERIIGN